MATDRPYPPLTPSRASVNARQSDDALTGGAAGSLLHRERLALNQEWRAYLVLLLIMDSFTVLFSLWLAYTLRISSGVVSYYGPSNQADYRALSLASLPVWLALFASMGLYRKDSLLGGTREYQQLFRACTAGVIAIMILSFLWRDEFVLVSRGWLTMAWALCTVFLITERFGARRIGYALRRRGHLTNRVLLVGANNQGLAMANQWIQSPTSGMQVIGYLDDFKPIGTEVADGLKVLGRPRNLHELSEKLAVDEVVVVPNAIAWETFEEIITDGNCDSDWVMRLSPGFYEIISTSVVVTDRSFVPLLTVHDSRLVGVDAVIKTAVDIGLGAPLFLLTLPVMGVIAVALKLEDPELPVFETTQVLRPNGRAFDMPRFRTRRPDGSVTTLSRLLEQTQLDRSPQLAHVIAGRMSLVGPRPQTATGDERYGRHSRSERTLKPGVIGPWSVWAEWVPDDEHSYDLYYVRNWTPWLDLQIITQSAMLSARKVWRRTRKS